MFNYTSYYENPDINQFTNKNGINIDNWELKPDNICTINDYKEPFSGNMGIWNKIYKKELIKNIKFEENYIFEDQLFHLQTILDSKGIYINNEVQYLYRQSDNSTVHTLGGNIFDVFLIMDRLETLLRNKGVYEKYKYNFLQHKYSDYIGLFVKSVLPLKEKFYNMASDDLKKMSDFEPEKIKELYNSYIYFDMTSLTYNEFIKKYKW